MIDYTAAGFTLLQGAHLYAPEDRGICDVLVANGKIIAVASNIPSDIVPDCTVVDLSGQILCPGFIDQHVHLIGGGGEAGPTTRTPEVALSRLTEAGVTSVVGLLGTDSISRHPESLLAKTRALNEEGISAWMLTGAYHVPSRTITGSVEKDVAIIDRVIGVKCAISDHRSAAPDVYHLANMAAESRVGGLLGGKPGVTVFHMGRLINRTLTRHSELSFSTFFVSSMSELLKQVALDGCGIAWLPEYAIQQEIRSGKLVVLNRDELVIPIQAYAYRMNTRMNPVAERFWRELRELEIVLS
ncbi:beta-aspartyl-peptidase [Escherichia coli]|nr:beta-aspartyl-peptidase [Escherichia coli]